MKITQLDCHRGSTRLFHGLDVDFPPGSYTLICGGTGTGKSTLALILAGTLTRGVSGSLDAPKEGVAAVWQDPAAQMCAPTVLDEVRRPLDYHLVPADEGTALARKLLQTVALEHIDPGHDPMRLSGGEQQRLAFAAAHALGAPVLVIDEATSQLDLQSREALFAAIDSIEGLTIVAIDHNVEAHLERATRIIVMGKGGRILYDGDTLPAHAHQWGVRMPGASFPSYRAKAVLSDKRVDCGPLSIPVGAIVALTGPNGAGKTTFLTSLTTNKTLVRAGIAWLPQRGSHHLSADSVAEELGHGAAAFTAQDCGLAGLETRHPLTLSGGQRQRLAVAAALGRQDIHVALLDEPSYSQDHEGTEQMINMVTRDAKQRVTIVASHDEAFIEAVATHRCEIREGKIGELCPI